MENETETEIHPAALADDDLIDSKQLAGWLHVRENQPAIWRWRRHGGPNFIKVGQRVLYRVGDVKHWLAVRTMDGGG